MQKHKPRFQDTSFTNTSIADVQRCLRLNDLDEIGDNCHHLVFHMMGLFSFRHWSVPRTLEYWYGFLRHVKTPLTHVTVHPDCFEQWRAWHRPYGLPVVADPGCVWSDGGMGGYCTEFYVDNIEVGNIVNPMGSCIDVGFGLERLEQVSGTPRRQSQVERLVYTLDVLAQSGVTPGPKTQRYVMRKLVRLLREQDGVWDNPIYQQELKRCEEQRKLYERLKNRHSDKPAHWWWDTHGIDVEHLT